MSVLVGEQIAFKDAFENLKRDLSGVNCCNGSIGIHCEFKDDNYLFTMYRLYCDGTYEKMDIQQTHLNLCLYGHYSNECKTKDYNNKTEIINMIKALEKLGKNYNVLKTYLLYIIIL